MSEENANGIQDQVILVRDDDFFVPRCLDEHVASVRLWTTSNYYNDGYDLRVSAFFGTERVLISVEDLELSTKISIQKAEVVVEGFSSDLVVLSIPSTQLSEITHKSIEEVSEHKNTGGNTSGKVSLSEEKAGLSLSGAFKRELGQQSVSKQIIEAKKIRSGWDLISDRTVRVYQGGQTLDGVELPEVALWRAVPKHTDRATGVAVCVRVREDWITFEGTRYEKGKSPIASAVGKLLTSENHRKKVLFDILIKHLSLLGLQKSDDKLQATLATTAIIVKPESDEALSVPSEGRVSLQLPSKSIYSFLDAEDGQEEAALVALGVPKHLIPPEPGFNVSSASIRGNSEFLPRGSPIDAVNALKLLVNSEPVSKDLLSERFGDNTIRDLSALKLVQRYKGNTISTSDQYKDVVRVVRHTASNAPSMKVTRAVLLANSKASVSEIADAVSLKLGRNWTNAGTRKRRGNALRRWSLWLEDYLIDTEANPDAKALVEFAKSTKKKIGGHTKVTPERADEARKLLQSGLSKRKIAKQLNVTAATLRKILEATKD
ncbi:helix-turn-helix domain-containing protein [uncultured Roseibium sp.]|uniref:helix-turn-helix domain-containing protein n=1 Tax=uncultured Roseibium sp. TaxID=1936171 RepID=UPI002601E086|nr:helix-turn-helix domain-containing protein [uncultured Roseibium sp.]